ncbi:MAG: phosphopyruvate hydratase [Ktedonobacteraceae bacterium]|nr:phosphopyruvate hydratase [Ktedonobacteraceae bacterium]
MIRAAGYPYDLASGAVGAASVPSGASTGAAEAHELRDGDPARYRGLGCRKAAASINGEIQQALASRSIEEQQELDRTLIALDGTPDKGRLGANALLAVSLAFARALANEHSMPLYQYFASLLNLPLRTLPRMTINLFSGGKHAGGQVSVQDVLIVPASARTIDEGLAMAFAAYQCAIEYSAARYNARALTADEGGLAPTFSHAEEMLESAVESIQRAGLRPGRDVALAIDVAASHFFSDTGYLWEGKRLDGSAMIDLLAEWTGRYPLVSIEDGLAENDWEHWPQLVRHVAGKVLIVGDDLICTNPKRIQRAIATQAANTLLLKVNQIGTLSEAAETCRLAREAGWQVTISARSGETEDNWLADLAVGWSGDQIKIGSITQSERLAKYNRLLEIEDATGLPVVAWPAS